LLLVLVTGVVADRFGRRTIMALATTVEALCAAALIALTLHGMSGPLPIFAVLAVFGTARAFFGPASSLVANLVSAEDFANAVAWNSSAWQMATAIAPMPGAARSRPRPQGPSSRMSRA
jgi:MFS family permease